MIDWWLVSAVAPPTIAILGTFFFWDRLRKGPDFLILAIFIFAFVVSSGLVYTALRYASPDNANSTYDYLNSFSSSLAQDVIFFSIIGTVIFILQRKDFFKDSKLDERLDFLFNRKTLSSHERSYLSQKIADCAADFISDEVHIDIKEIDLENNAIKIDVFRRFSVGNYLKDKTAVYHMDVYVGADDTPFVEDSVRIHPVFKNVFSRSEYFQKKPQDRIPVGASKPLTNQVLLKSGEKFDKDDIKVLIEAEQVVECSYRWEGWQLILPESLAELKNPSSHDDDQSPAVTSAIADGTETEEIDSSDIPPKDDGEEAAARAYRISVQKHWDRMSISVSNDLDSSVHLEVVIGDTARNIELPPGRPSLQFWRAKNVRPNQTILIKFLNFVPHKGLVQT